MHSAKTKVKQVKDHRPFILLALVGAAVVGSLLGGWILLGWLGWVSPLSLMTVQRAHGLIQVYGFVSLFTMGVAILMLCNPMRVPASPVWLARAIPLLIALGIGASLEWQGDGENSLKILGPGCLSLAALSFIGVLWVTRQKSVALNKKRESFNLTQLVLMTLGASWLVVTPWLSLIDSTQALETVLWGFTAQYIFAVGARSHTAILSIKGIYEPLLPLSGGILNIALVVRWAVEGPAWSWIMTLAVVVYLVCLRPFRSSVRPAPGSTWLRAFVRTSYVWLLAAVALSLLAAGPYPAFAGAARHALGSGFVLTMIVGMAFRMIPAFEVRRILWTSGPWVIYWVLLVGTTARVIAQALGPLSIMAVGGALQVAAVWLFAGLLVGTSLWGEDLTAPDYIRRQKALQEAKENKGYS